MVLYKTVLTWGILIMGISIASYSINRFYFSLSILFYRQNCGRRKSRGHRTHTKRPVTTETETPQDRLLPVLEKEGKKERPQILQYPIRGFSSFFVLFPLDRLVCHSPFTDRHSMALTTCTHCRRPPHPPGIAIRTLNIWDGRGFGLAQAIWAVEHGGFDVMLLTETKIQSEA